MSGLPYRYVVFDTETRETVIRKEPRHVSLKFDMGVSKFTTGPLDQLSRVEYLDFNDPEEFFSHLDSIPYGKDKIWVFAHNLGFDIRSVGLFREISKGRYTLLNPNPPKSNSKVDTPFIVLDDPPTIIRTFRPDGQELLWCDTWQWLSSSLAKIGQILGNAKGVDPGPEAPRNLRFDYCRQDVDVLDDAMRRIFKWLHENKWNVFHPTRAGQSMLIFNQSYNKKRIKLHNDPELQAIERPSYYGGFTEVFKVGKVEGPIHQVDVNSLYPYVMSKHWYPAELVNSSLDGSDNTKYVSTRANRCIAEVYLNSKDNTYPLRCMEGTLFPKGKIRTYLSGPELVRAFREGDVDRVTKFTEYSLQPLFAEFVKDIYSARLRAKREGNEIFDYCYKLMLNSLYGKFGQQTSEWIYQGPTDPQEIYDQGYAIDATTGETTETRIIAGTSYIRTERYDHPKSFVSIASFVTAYAREYMREFREILGEGSYFYQATDSLYINDSAYQYLTRLGKVDKDRLGFFKHEDTYKSLIIRNIHNLDKDDKKIRGSIRGKAVEVAPDTFEQEAWESLLPAIKSGHHAEIQIKTVIKKLTAKYQRRLIDSSGCTYPHTVDTWDTPPEVMARRWLLRGGFTREE